MEELMAKTKKTQAAGINLNADNITIGGDVIGGDKIVHDWRGQVNLEEAKKLVAEIRSQIEGMQEVDKRQKEKLQEMVGEINNEIKSTTPNADNVLDKLKTLQNTLITIHGIGAAGLGL